MNKKKEAQVIMQNFCLEHIKLVKETATKLIGLGIDKDDALDFIFDLNKTFGNEGGWKEWNK